MSAPSWLGSVGRSLAPVRRARRGRADTPARDIMTSPVVTIGPDESVHNCMEIMTQKRIRHLPVLERGKVVGMISIGDLVKAVIEEQQQTIDQLERYIAS